jgi:ABC-type transport system involved in Fe-S cluster assembly fused permease/ATPase subunit
VNPTSGEISIDRKTIPQLGLQQARSLIGSVSQDCMLFNESLKENVKYSRLDATDKEIEIALEQAGFDITKFKDGIDTNVGERGLAMSGGEKQRIAIARLILKHPNAVILDEATSSLDTITEKQVSRKIPKNRKD